MLTNIKRLQAFVAIAEQSSFTVAAEQLSRTQPAISVQLRELEDEIGFQLIERSRGRVATLSASGNRLLPHAKKLLDSCRELDSLLQEMRPSDPDHVSLGVDPITLYMPERNRLIAMFLESYRDKLEIVSCNPAQLYAGLRTGKLDMIITSDVGSSSNYDSLTLHQDNLRLAVPKSGGGKIRKIQQGRFSGSRILIMPSEFHPAIYSHVRFAFKDEDIDWVECPEANFEALIRYASMMGISTLSPDFSESLATLDKEMDLLEIPDRSLELRWCLMRQNEGLKRSSDELWQLAARAISSAPH